MLRLHSKAIRVDAFGNMFVHGVTEFEVKTAQEAFQLFYRGKKRRHLGVTRSNINSTHSHCVFNIRLVQVKDLVTHFSKIPVQTVVNSFSSYGHLSMMKAKKYIAR